MPTKVSMVTKTMDLDFLRRGKQYTPQHNGPAFAFFAQTHGEPCVFHADENSESPDDEGKYTDHICLGRFKHKKDYRECIDRACADIAKNKPERFDDPCGGTLKVGS